MAAQSPEGPGTLQCPNCGCTVPVFDQNTLVSAGRSAVESPPDEVDLRIEGYQIVGKLGKGGMGVVLEGLQTSLSRKVAIKVLSPRLAKDPNLVARFEREIAALVRLSHPHIITILDQGRAPGGHVYYIMEYVKGEGGGPPKDLERLIADRCLDAERTLELILQVVQALGFVHREGIIHRDIKPANILVDRHGFAKVADFGIAGFRAAHQRRHLTLENTAVGTMIYMSPEQLQDAASVDHRTDVYSTGVMLYQMLTGELPFPGYEPPSKAVPGLNPAWDAIVAKALQPKPENRFADMAEFEKMLKSLGPTSVTPPPMTCPHCGAGITEADQFCLKCRGSLSIDCRQCGKKVLAGAEFCPSCRADVRRFRLFEEHLRLGKEGLEKAKGGAPSVERVQQLEQARLALAKALSYLDDPDARSLLDEAARLTGELAWEAAEAAIQAKRFAEAGYCCEQLLEVSPDHAAATARLDQIRAYRSERISKTQQAFEQGKIKKALALLVTAAESFADDEEIGALLAKCREKAERIEGLQARIGQLAKENKWCEISQIVAELRQIGIPIKGLDEYAARVEQKLALVGPLVASAKWALDRGNHSEALAQANQVLAQVSDHVEALELAELARAQPEPPRRRRAPAFWLSLALGILAAVGCAAAVPLPWMDVPESPGKQAGGDTRFPARDQPARQAPKQAKAPRDDRFFPYPIAVLVLTIVGVCVPFRRSRGSILLVAGLAAGGVWFVVVRQIQEDLLMWTPLVRYLEAPEAFGTWQPGEAVMGAGPWVMLAAVVVLLVASAINLCRSVPSTLLVLGSTLLLAVSGPAYLSFGAHRARPDARISEPEVTVSPLGFQGAGAVATFVVHNPTARPVALVPADRPSSERVLPSALLLPFSGADRPGSSAAGSPGEHPGEDRWFREWGRPDLILRFEKHDGFPEDKGRGQGGPILTFRDSSPVGCVLRPNERVEIIARFAPVWEPGRYPTMAGHWTVSLENAGGRALATRDIEVPGVPHPNDQRIDELAGRLGEEKKRAEGAINEFKRLSRQGRTAGSPIRPAAQAIAKLLEAQRALAAASGTMGTLERLGEKPSPDDQRDLAQRTQEVSATAQWISQFQRLLAARQYGEAFESIPRLSQAAPAGEQIAASVRSLLPDLLVEQVQNVADRKQHDQVVGLLAAVNQSELKSDLESQPELRGKVASVLEHVALEKLSDSGALVAPDGSVGGPSSDRRNQQFIEVLNLAIQWNPALEKRDDFAYARLLADRLTGKLTEQQVTRFSKEHPKYAAEAACWLGLRAFEAQDLAAAGKYLAEARQLNPDSPYARFAGAGQGLISWLSAKGFYGRAGAARQLQLAMSGEEGKTFAPQLAKLSAKLLQREEVSELTRLLQGGDYSWVDSFSRITTEKELDDFLAQPASKRVVWVQLEKKEVDKDGRLEKLKRWVKEGGILWTDTDLARAGALDDKEFGFRLRNVDRVEGEAEPPPSTRHPITEGLVRPVRVVLSPSSLLVSIPPDPKTGKLDPPQGVTLLLGCLDERGKLSLFACAMRPYGMGSIVYRPREVVPAKQGELFEKNMLRFFGLGGR
jgi:serine/threonine protein kinase